MAANTSLTDHGQIQGVIASPETYKTNFNPLGFVQFGKQHSRYNPILLTIVLSQQCCETYFISLLQ